MEPTETQQPSSSSPRKKILLFIGVGLLFFILALGVFYIIVLKGGGAVGENIRTSLFGEADDTTVVPGGGGDGKLGDVGIPDGNSDVLPRMWKIDPGPVSGSVFKTLPDGTLAVRYVLREDGDVYEYNMPSRSGRILANNTIPRVAEALWDARGASVILRTATDQGNIVSVLGKLLPNPATSTGDEAPAILQQSFLPENIAFASASPFQGFVHTLRVGNELSIMLVSPDGQSSTPVFTSPFTEWIPDWMGKDHLILTTRPSGTVGGYAFSLDPRTGVTTPIASDYFGLTTKSAPDGEHIFLGGVEKSGMTFAIVAKGYSLPSAITPATLPEKCAWTASSTFAYCGVPQSPARALYPDEWYQGVAQFSDTIWVYDTDMNQFTPFLIPANEAGVSVDIINPSMSPDGKYLIFTDKKDGALWGVLVGADDTGAAQP